jgi:hypothetical protein
MPTSSGIGHGDRSEALDLKYGSGRSYRGYGVVGPRLSFSTSEERRVRQRRLDYRAVHSDDAGLRCGASGCQCGRIEGSCPRRIVDGGRGGEKSAVVIGIGDERGDRTPGLRERPNRVARARVFHPPDHVGTVHGEYQRRYVARFRIYARRHGGAIGSTLLSPSVFLRHTKTSTILTMEPILDHEFRGCPTAIKPVSSMSCQSWGRDLTSTSRSRPKFRKCFYLCCLQWRQHYLPPTSEQIT